MIVSEALAIQKIGVLFEKRRTELGITLRQAEESTGVPQYTIARIENGTTTKPAFLDVVKLADYYGFATSTLLREAGLRDTNPDQLPTSEAKNKVMTLVKTLLEEAEDGDLDWVIQTLTVYTRYLASRTVFNPI